MIRRIAIVVLACYIALATALGANAAPVATVVPVAAKVKVSTSYVRFGVFKPRIVGMQYKSHRTSKKGKSRTFDAVRVIHSDAVRVIHLEVIVVDGIHGYEVSKSWDDLSAGEWLTVETPCLDKCDVYTKVVAVSKGRLLSRTYTRDIMLLGV